MSTLRSLRPTSSMRPAVAGAAQRKTFLPIRLSSPRSDAGRSSLRIRASVTIEKASLDMNTMSPLHDRILVKPIEEEQVDSVVVLMISQQWRTRMSCQPCRQLAMPHVITPVQKTAGGILLPKGPPKANSDAHFGTVRWSATRQGKIPR